MPAPLVSLCIPTYNAARTLRATLDSLLSQTYEPFEIVISDNASSDETLEIVGAYRDARLRVVRLEQNIGAEGNFERCLSLGRGEYTGIFHADDVYEPEIVARQIAFLEATPEAGAVFTAAHVIDETGRRTGTLPLPPELRHATAPLHLDQEAFVRAILRHGNFVVCPAVMARSRIYQQEIQHWNGQEFASSADLDVWLRIAERHAIGFIPEALINYRRSQQQGSHTIHHLRTTPAHMMRVLEHHMASPSWNRFLTASDRRDYARLLHKDIVIRTRNALRKGELGEGLTILREIPPLSFMRALAAAACEMAAINLRNRVTI